MADAGGGRKPPRTAGRTPHPNPWPRRPRAAVRRTAGLLLGRDGARSLLFTMTSDPEPHAIPAPVPIRTPRLMLRPCREGDGTALAEAVAESFDALRPWFHVGLGPREREVDPTWQEVVACRHLARFKARERLALLAFDGDRLVALVELIHPDWRRRAFGLSYWVRTSAQRRGYGTEAVGAATRWAFGALEARRVTVGHAVPNRASAALIARLGFAPVSRMPRGAEMPGELFVDGLGYAMTDPAPLPPLDVRWRG